ncbi:MAG: ATP-grasp domain-containing protein [Anaerocolumna sp.]
MDKVIVFIKSIGITKLDVVKAVREKGYRIAIAEKGYDNSNKIADYLIDTEADNIDMLISDIAEFSLEHEVAAILSFTESGIEQAAAVTQVLGYPGPNYKSIKICRNKYLTRIEMKKNGLPTPGFFKAKSLGEIKDKISALKFPVIIKPLNFSGSCSVARVDEFKELEDKFKLISSQREDSPFKDFMGDNIHDYWLIEEYLEGFEISVECFTYKGETFVAAIHDKMCQVEAPYFLEEVFVTPSPRISTELSNVIIDLTKRVLKTIDFNFGLSHVEYRVTKEGPVLLEINGRQGGGMVAESVCYSVGVNLPKIMVEMSLGMTPDVKLEKPKPVVFQTLIVEEGTIKEAKGFEDAQKNEKLKIAEQWAKPGDIIKARQAEYGGFILATGNEEDDVNKIINIVKDAASKIEFTIE